MPVVKLSFGRHMFVERPKWNAILTEPQKAQPWVERRSVTHVVEIGQQLRQKNRK